MRYLDQTLTAPEQDLALDETLLDWCETGNGGGDAILRVWSPGTYFVVVGYANAVATEVDTAACARAGVPVLRRCSGGGTVVQGPGCLNYTLILDSESSPELAGITGTNDYVMRRNRAAIQKLVSGEVRIEGHTDLAISGVKFSGNAQRRKRRWILFHGTFLLDFALEKIDEFLRFPSKVPDYRAGRPHHAFVTNLNLPAAAVIHSLRETWQATAPSPLPPDDLLQALLREKYARPDWHAKF